MIFCVCLDLRYFTLHVQTIHACAVLAAHSHRPSPAIYGTKRALAVEDEWTCFLSPVDPGFTSVMFGCVFFCLMLRLENLFQRLCIPQKHQQIFTAALRMLVLPAHQLLIQHGVSNAALMHAGLPVEQRDLAWANGESSRCQVSIYWKKYIKTIETKIVLIQRVVTKE